jgi:anthranilate synthase component 1
MPTPLSTPLPHTFTLLADCATPLQLYSALTQAEPQAPLMVLLESADGDSRLARYSLLGWKAQTVASLKAGQLTLTPAIGEVTTQPCTQPFAFLREYHHQFLQQQGLSPTTVPQGSEGGWMGYVGYGCVSYLEAIPQQAADPLNVPDLLMGFFDVVLRWDHVKRTLTLISYRSAAESQALYQQLLHTLQHSHSGLNPMALTPSISSVNVANDALFAPCHGPFTQTTYCQAVEACQHLIHQGEVFQIVLAQRFSKAFAGNPLAIYRALLALNPSPYAYVLKTPHFTYLGASPETFVQAQPLAAGQAQPKQVLLRALAGTRPRGATPEADTALAVELRAHPKEMAEHRMLVDLARNDLGRVCQAGSVQVGELAQVHYYTHVMHLATDVFGELRPEKDGYDVWASVLPRGTVSGAPKIRAMHHLAQLEPEQRGIYAGAVGYVDLQGNVNTCIAIRSALVKADAQGVQQVHVQAGAGVVLDSVPLDEFEETRNKAKSLWVAIAQAEAAAAATDSLTVLEAP